MSPAKPVGKRVAKTAAASDPIRIPSKAEIDALNAAFEKLQDAFDEMPADARIQLWPVRGYIRDIIQQLSALSLSGSAQDLDRLARSIGSTTKDLTQLKKDLDSLREMLTTTAALLKALSPVLALV